MYKNIYTTLVSSPFNYLVLLGEIPALKISWKKTPFALTIFMSLLTDF